LKINTIKSNLAGGEAFGISNKSNGLIIAEHCCNRKIFATREGTKKEYKV